MQKQGSLSVTFVDNSYLQGATKEKCEENVNTTINLLTSLGFTNRFKKSVLEPVQSIQFSGLVIDFTTISVKINTNESKIILNENEELEI